MINFVYLFYSFGYTGSKGAKVHVISILTKSLVRALPLLLVVGCSKSFTADLKSNATSALVNPTATPFQIEPLVGTITRLAGAPINQPATVTVDLSGNIYTTNITTKTLLKIDSLGNPTIIGPTIGGTTLVGPESIAADALGGIYIADVVQGTCTSLCNKIYRYVPSTNTITLIQSAAAIDAATTTKASATGKIGAIAMDNERGLLYVESTVSNDSTYFMNVSNLASIGAFTWYSGAPDPGSPIAIGQNGDPIVSGTNTGGHAGIAISEFLNSPVFAFNTSAITPSGLTYDPSGNLFFSLASSAQQIFKYGEISPFAVAGVYGQNGFSNGTTATFNNPSALAPDASGNIYIADTSNNAIRKLSTGGSVSTLSTSIVGAGIVVDSNGVSYVADPTHHVVFRISPSGDTTVIAGVIGQTLTSSGFDAINSSPSTPITLLNTPSSVALDPTEQFLYVADYDTSIFTSDPSPPGGNATSFIFKINLSTLVMTLYSFGDDQSGDNSTFIFPTNLVQTGGNLYLMSAYNGTLWEVNSTSDFYHNAVAFAPSITIKQSNGSPFNATTNFGTAMGGIAVDPLGEYLYVMDSYAELLYKINLSTQTYTTIMLTGNSDSQYQQGLAFDTFGNLYDADVATQTIYLTNPATGVQTTFLSSGFTNMPGIAFDPYGYLHAIDAGNQRVLLIK